MNKSSLLIPPEVKTWTHTRISGKFLFLDLLHNMFFEIRLGLGFLAVFVIIRCYYWPLETIW